MSTSPLDGATVTTVLCDADGTLFASEEQAYVASAVVARQLADHYGLIGDFSPEGLRQASTGRNFRATTADRLTAAGVPYTPADLEHWVGLERDAVTARLAGTLTVDDDVLRAVKDWAQRYRLAVVSSSASARLDACFEVTGLDEYFPAALRFSAEESLATPVSKPDPAIYLHALRELGCEADQAVAIEDSVSGALSAVGAGLPTLGIVYFAPVAERAALREALLEAGAVAVAGTWGELAGWL